MSHRNPRTARFIRSNAQGLMALALINTGTMQCALDPDIMATAGGVAVNTARRYMRTLEGADVMKFWSWEVRGEVYTPHVYGPNGQPDYIWLPGPAWHAFVQEAIDRGLKVRPLKEVRDV